MNDDATRGEDVSTLVLQALIRKLANKGLLSREEVEALLLDAVERSQALGGQPTPEAARDYVESELAPAYLAGL